MLTLYYRPSCPYCQRVVQAAAVMALPLVLRDIMTSSEALADLLAVGGKRQVPFLHDSARGVFLYESLDIIEYLRTHYQPTAELALEPVLRVCPID